MSKLFTPLNIGEFTIQHRVALAPLTRSRQYDNGDPFPWVKDYYVQRGSVPGTLLLTEGIVINNQTSGHPRTASLFKPSHIAGWKEVTDAVHKKGSFIWAQIFSMGRAEKAQPTDGRRGVLSPSEVPIDSSWPTPLPMTEEEIEASIADYVQAARNAMEAGFDGVELHGANGYLIDQFTQDVSNKRTDRWGGSVENRSRYGIEVTKAVVRAIGASRVSFRISPYSTYQNMCMEDPMPQFSHLVSELSKLSLAFLHVVTARVNGNLDSDNASTIDFAIENWTNGKPVLVAGGLSPHSAKNLLEDWKERDIVAVFGRYYIANPDLPFRLKNGLELARWDRDSFYTKGPEGYTDYPFHPNFCAMENKSTYR